MLMDGISVANMANHLGCIGVGNLFWIDEGLQPKKVAVQFEHVVTPGFLMKVVDVLRHHRHLSHKGLKLRYGQVARIRLRFADKFGPMNVPIPNQLLMLAKSLGAGDLLRVELGPQPSLRIPKRWNTTFCGHACTGEHHQTLAGAELIAKVAGNHEMKGGRGLHA